MDNLEDHKIRKETKPRTNTCGIASSAIVVGAGWAGLACAIKLAQAGHKITLIEATPHAGGRARSINFSNHMVDNGQHLLIGAYTETLKLLQSIGVDTKSVLKRSNMRLQFKALNPHSSLRGALGDEAIQNITIPKLFAPLHVITGLALAHGLTSKEKLLIAKLFVTLHKTKFVLLQDCPILTALKELSQSEHLIKYLWEPIALAVMSTPIAIASANVFFRVLKDIFTGSQSNSNWLFTSKDLDQLLPIPAIQYLAANGASIIFQQPITELLYKDGQCIGVANDANAWYAQNIVLATPPLVTIKLLANSKSNIAKALSQINYNTITTIYFLFAKPVHLPYSMIGLLDSPIQWLCSRSISAQPNILSGVITSNLDKAECSNDELTQAAIKQLQKHFPQLPELLDTKVIKEKRAAFMCTPEVQNLRPTNTTDISNLFLAGDYTQTSYPATIEGAVRSGVGCAGIISLVGQLYNFIE